MGTKLSGYRNTTLSILSFSALLHAGWGWKNENCSKRNPFAVRIHFHFVTNFPPQVVGRFGRNCGVSRNLSSYFQMIIILLLLSLFSIENFFENFHFKSILTHIQHWLKFHSFLEACTINAAAQQRQTWKIEKLSIPLFLHQENNHKQSYIPQMVLHLNKGGKPS